MAEQTDGGSCHVVAAEIEQRREHCCCAGVGGNFDGVGGSHRNCEGDGPEPAVAVATQCLSTGEAGAAGAVRRALGLDQGFRLLPAGVQFSLGAGSAGRIVSLEREKRGAVAKGIKVKNLTEHDSAEVRRLVRQTLRDFDISAVAVTIRYRRGGSTHATGRYRASWYPQRGEDREQIIVSLPRGERIDSYIPYRRRQAPPSFELNDWREAVVAIVAHEGQHHRQLPRARFGERECDWAAYRAVMRYRGEIK